MKYSEFYRLIEQRGWTIKGAKGTTNMCILTTLTSFQSADTKRRRYRKVLLTVC